MNTFKKIMASVLAITSVTSVAGVMANAEETNAVSVSYETLTSAITADDGTVIPAGAVAVEVAINNNTGFIGSSITFDVSNANIITDSEGAPIMENGSVIEGAMTSAAKSETKMVFANSNTDSMQADGELFTFYMSSVATLSIIDTEFVTNTEPKADIAEAYALKKYWIKGDANGDLTIGLDDVTIVNTAVQRGGGMMVGVADLNEDLVYYFSNTRIPMAEFVDGNDDGYVMDSEVREDMSDAQQIMNYYTQTAAGLVYNEEDWDIGETVTYYV